MESLTSNWERTDFNGLFASDGAWCFFADPRALYYEGSHRRTYVGWVTSKGDIKLGFYDHDNGNIEEVMVHPQLQRDDHANPSLYIDSRGKITIFYSAHGGSKLYYRTTRILEDIHTLGEECTIPVNTEGKKGYTYPTPIYLEDEDKLYLFWRGGNFKPNFSTCIDLESNRWSLAQTLIQDKGHRPYIRFTTNHKDEIHFAFTDGHPHAEPTNSIYYACYRNGSFYHADGEKFKQLMDLPMTVSEAETVYDGKAFGKNSWIWDIALDRNGYPVIVYVVFHDQTDHRYCCSRWDGVKWITNEITAAGSWFPQTPEGKRETEPCYSAGIILDQQNPDNVFLSRQVEEAYQIEKWTTSDLGRTWQSIVVATSETQLQVRPFVSRSSNMNDWPSILFWMEGTYIGYTNYQTSLRMQPMK